MTFNELNLSAPVLRAVAQAGYESPSPIQAAAIPPVLAGRDLMGCAQTGTGKTAAFALPMLDRLTASAPRKKGAIRALILTPTRELALQIGESFEAYGKYLKLRSTVIFGGVGQAPQVEALKKGVDILIACPGRLNDLIGQGFIDLSALEIFVLDEADRMLDMGFVHDVKKVIAKLPAQRQNLMFSATMPAEIEQLAAGILHDPAFVKVDPVSSTVDRIQQSLYYVEKGNKKLLLPWLIKNLQPPVVNALVFSRTKHGADKIAKDLTKQGIPAAAIHGKKSQTARVTALEDFKSGKTRDFDTPTVLFIEEIGEQMYRLDRMMQQLERSGILAKCKAVLVGHFTDMLGQKHFGIWDPCDIIAAYVRPLGIPVVFGIPAGHEDPNVALYMGREVAVTVNDAGASIEF